MTSTLFCSGKCASLTGLPRYNWELNCLSINDIIAPLLQHDNIFLNRDSEQMFNSFDVIPTVNCCDYN